LLISTLQITQQFISTSLYLVRALHNGYSSALSSLDVFWQRILAMEVLQLPLPASWHSTAEPSTRNVDCLQDNSSVRTPRKTIFSVVKNACLLARYLAMDICEPHRKPLLRRRPCCCVLVFQALHRNGSTCHSRKINEFVHKLHVMTSCSMFSHRMKSSHLAVRYFLIAIWLTLNISQFQWRGPLWHFLLLIVGIQREGFYSKVQFQHFLVTFTLCRKESKQVADVSIRRNAVRVFSDLVVIAECSV
jgi:hypothetical protein